MKTLLLCLAVVAYLSAGCSPALAAPSDDARRPCKRQDLIGTWYMINMAASFAFSETDAWYFPYQMFVFGEDGSFKHWAGTKPSPERKILLETMPKSQAFSIDDSNGHLVTTNVRTMDQMAYTCEIWTRDSGDNKAAGDCLACRRLAKRSAGR
jgi:hypothetical protein